MLHSIETNQNKEVMNMKSLSCHSVVRHHKCITGMQFCHFECTEMVSLVKKFSLKIVDYTLMLPYARRGFPLQKQFTLVYSDWEVLLCDNNPPDGNKGPVYMHRPLFEDILSQSLLFFASWLKKQRSQYKMCWQHDARFQP